ncbi:flotillin [bacterium K02(2017)]|nr:flotillin [bacterium K02(2017)]
MMDGLTTIFFVSIVTIIALVAIGMILSRLYRRSSKEISFVRTGFGGQKIILNGGALVFPVLHEIIHVNMNTLRLVVHRANEAALITKDRMRVDVQAEFYVRVKPTAEAIADAAQTLGKRTMVPAALKDLVEGKFVDALRAVAAEMAMDELHEQRVDFVQKVQKAVSEDLLKNGLELESVSLTSLDQTDQSHFNPNNAFDAQGLTKLTEEIEERRKQRNDIEQDTEVKVREKNLEAEQLKLEIKKKEEYARFDQEREVEVRRAQQQATIKEEQAIKEQAALEAQIQAKQQVDLKQIIAERKVEEERIDKEKLLKEKDINKVKVVETAEIDRKKTVELTDQDRYIAIAIKSKEQSEAEAQADKARALAIKSKEQVTTAKETEIAERDKAIRLVEAAKEAEQEAIGITVAAKAEKTASIDQADAVKIIAQGLANKVTIAAQADAESEIVRAEAADKRYTVDAAGQKALNEAENTLTDDIVAMRIKLSLIENLDKIVRESVKPMEAIDDIKIIQIEGINPNGGNSHSGLSSGSTTVGHDNGNLAEQVVNSALRYRSQAPLIDSLMKEVGIEGGDLDGLTAALKASEKNGSKPQKKTGPTGVPSDGK